MILKPFLGELPPFLKSDKKTWQLHVKPQTPSSFQPTDTTRCLRVSQMLSTETDTERHKPDSIPNQTKPTDWLRTGSVRCTEQCGRGISSTVSKGPTTASGMVCRPCRHSQRGKIRMPWNLSSVEGLFQNPPGLHHLLLDKKLPDTVPLLLPCLLNFCLSSIQQVFSVYQPRARFPAKNSRTGNIYSLPLRNS